MFSSPGSPAVSSMASLILAAAAAVLLGLFFVDALHGGRAVLIIVSMIIAFAAVVAGMFTIGSPGPGMGLALLGMGLGVGVIVLGFLVFLLRLAHS